MVDLTSLAVKSGMAEVFVAGALRGGVDATILDFALHSGLKIAPGLVTLEAIKTWIEKDELSNDEVDIMIAELVKDEIEEFFGDSFGVVGKNPPNRPQGTGF